MCAIVTFFAGFYFVKAKSEFLFLTEIHAHVVHIRVCMCMSIFCAFVSMWPMACVSVPAEPSAETLCHLQPGRESGSPHRSTHGWAPCANTIPIHSVTFRHVHMHVLHIYKHKMIVFFIICSLQYLTLTRNRQQLCHLLFLSFLNDSLTICCSDPKHSHFPPPCPPRLLTEKEKC